MAKKTFPKIETCICIAADERGAYYDRRNNVSGRRRRQAYLKPGWCHSTRGGGLMRSREISWANVERSI